MGEGYNVLMYECTSEKDFNTRTCEDVFLENVSVTEPDINNLDWA